MVNELRESGDNNEASESAYLFLQNLLALDEFRQLILMRDILSLYEMDYH